MIVKFFNQMVKVNYSKGTEITVDGYEGILGQVEKRGREWIAEGRGKKGVAGTKRDAVKDLLFRIEYR